MHTHTGNPMKEGTKPMYENPVGYAGFTQTENRYCEKCGKLMEGIFAGDPTQILCQCNAPELFTAQDKIDFLNIFCQWLERHGYMDTDWKDEEPYAIDEFLKEQRRK